MLEDRYYMRQTPFGMGRSVTLILLCVNVAVFLLQLMLEKFTSLPLNAWFALSSYGLIHGYVWQLLTFQFMHAGWLHLLLNCWALYVFGREVEESLGAKRFLTLYFFSGVVGGLFQALVGLVIGRFAAPVVGASAGVFGLIAAFATLYPERPLMLLLFFIIPVSMRAKFLLLFSAIFTLIGIAFPTDNVAHMAHLGGMLTGMAFIRYALDWNWHWPHFSAGSGSARRRVRVISGAGGWNQSGSRSEEDLPADEFLSKEVDPILDKISAQGIQSLTDRERRILEAARERMKH